MTKHMTRSGTTWTAYLLLALYSYCLNIFGPITPFLRDEFHLSYTVSSLHFSAFAVGILVVGLAGQLVISKIGRRQALSLGALGLGIGSLLLALGRTPVVTIGAAFLMGCVGSLILALVPAMLAEEHAELRGVALSEANLISSLTGGAAPLLVGWWAHLLVGWRLALFLATLLALVAAVVVFRPNRARLSPPSSSEPGRRLPFLFWFYWTGIALAVAIEFCMIYWIASYMQSELHLPPASAAQCVSLFLAGMMAGRLLSSRLLRYLSTRSLVIISILVGMLGFGLFWSTINVPATLAGLVLAGLGVAALYPLIVSLAFGAAPGCEAQAGVPITLASGVAILALPLLLGRLADFVGIRDAYAVVAVLFGIVGLMMVSAGRLSPGITAAQRPVETASK